MKHNIKGLILDFNGTLYLDHDLNYISWSNTFNRLKPKGETLEYKDFDKTGLVNDYLLVKGIFKLFNIEGNDEDIDRYSKEKELEYKKLAIENNKNELIKGTEELLDYIKDSNIPYCIASMAPIENFDFYLDYLHLDRWFTYNNIVYDNGKHMTKNSQIIEAAKRMNLDPKDCLLIEDNPDNIRLAIEELGMDKFIYINTKDIDYKSDKIIQEIKNYKELDYSIFNK